MSDRKVKGRVEFVIVEFGIEIRPELECGTRFVGDWRIAVAAPELDRFFVQPSNACRDGAQCVEVAEFQVEDAELFSVARKLYIAARHELDQLGKKGGRPPPNAPAQAGARAQNDQAVTRKLQLRETGRLHARKGGALE